ncbi:C4-dicarboxylate transporter DctA, partial [Mycobacterium sp. ITM-2017-0098]
VGIVVPTGYSFNLDGTAIYLTMASLFVADALGDPLSITEQLGRLAFMIIQSHRPELLDGDRPFDESTMVDDEDDEEDDGVVAT